MVLYILTTMLVVTKIIGIVALLIVAFLFLQMSCDSCDQIRRTHDQKGLDDLKLQIWVFMSLGILLGFGCFKILTTFWGG